MTQPTTIKGGKVAILLGDQATPTNYSAPCGLTQRSMTISKGLEDALIPDCDDPDAVDWPGRDAVSVSMAANGDGMLAEESVEAWLDAAESPDSVPAKVIWTFPAKTITWTGLMQVDSFAVTAQNGRRVTNTVSLQSDGKMVRVVS
jgi:hypothetical protein